MKPFYALESRLSDLIALKGSMSPFPFCPLLMPLTNYLLIRVSVGSLPGEDVGGQVGERPVQD